MDFTNWHNLSSNLKKVLSNFWYLNSVLVEISRKPQHYLQPTIQNKMLTCQNFSIFNENRKSAEMDFFFQKNIDRNYRITHLF